MPTDHLPVLAPLCSGRFEVPGRWGLPTGAQARAPGGKIRGFAVEARPLALDGGLLVGELVLDRYTAIDDGPTRHSLVVELLERGRPGVESSKPRLCLDSKCGCDRALLRCLRLDRAELAGDPDSRVELGRIDCFREARKVFAYSLERSLSIRHTGACTAVPFADLAASFQAAIESAPRALPGRVNVQVIRPHARSDARQQVVEASVFALELALALATIAGRLADCADL